MLQDLLPILPQSLGTTGVVVCMLGIALGLLTWVAGGVWSRPLVTLIAVAFGGAAGMLLPRWYIWPVNSMSIAVLGAIVLGVSAYAAPRIWVGLVLGVVLVAWATLGTWLLLRGETPFETRPDWQVETMTPPEHAKDIWQRLPEPVRRVVPYSVATAMISAFAITLLWPKFSRALMGGMLGTTLLLFTLLTLLLNRKAEWLQFVPAPIAAQGGIVAGFVLLGALLDWQLLPGPADPKTLDEAKEQQSSPPDGR